MPKVTITELQANQLVFLAGVKAEQEAAKSGIAPEESSTLLRAAVGGKAIGGVVFPPIHAAFQMLVERVNDLTTQRRGLGSPMGQMAAMAFLLKEPEMAWQMIDAEDQGKLFEDTVIRFGLKLTLTDLKHVAEWIASEMKALSDDEPAGK